MALVLTVYSFFSDILSPCPANWKKKENGGQRDQRSRWGQGNRWTNRRTLVHTLFFTKRQIWLVAIRQK